MASFEKISPNRHVPRNRPVRRLTPHHVAGNLTAERTLGLQNFIRSDVPNRVSATYAIGSNGNIGLGLEETNRPWTSSSEINDNEAITFEIANHGGAPDWPMSDAALNAWLDLAVEICKFYGYTSVMYKPRPAGIANGTATEAWIASWNAPKTAMLITLHQWYAATACPGPFFVRNLPWLTEEINSRLSGKKPIRFSKDIALGTSVLRPIVPTIPSPGVPVPFDSYIVRPTVAALNVRSGPGTNTSILQVLRTPPGIAVTIVQETNGPGANRWGRLKSKVGWIALDHTQRV